MKRAWILLILTLFAYTANAQTVVGNLSRDVTATGNITTNGDSLVVDVQGVPSATIKVGGTFTGTLSFRKAVDFGACTDTAPVTVDSTSPSSVSSATATGAWTFTNLGATKLCVTATASMTGTAVVAFTRGAASAAGGGSTSGSINVADPSTPSQKAAVNASGQLSITCANCSGSGASAVDESTFTQGVNSVAPTGVLFKTSYTALTTGQVGIIRGSAGGELFGVVRDAAGNNRGANVSAGNALLVDASATTQPVSGTITAVTAITNALPAGSNVIGHVIADSGSTTAVTGTVTAAGAKTNNNAAPGATNVGALGGLANAAAPSWTEGNLVAMSTDLHGSQRATLLDSGGTTMTDATAHGLKVEIVDTTGAAVAASSLLTHGVAPTWSSVTGGSLLGHGKATAPTAVTADQAVAPWLDLNGRVQINGDASMTALRIIGNAGGAFDAATAATVPANAVYSGGIGKTALPTAVSDGQLVGEMSDKFGRRVSQPWTVRDLIGSQTTTISASTSETTVVTAAASTFNDIACFIVSNTSASTNTRVDFRDTTGGSILFSLQSIGGGPPVGFCPPIPFPQTTVNTNWTAQAATSTTDLRVTALFAKNK